MNDPMCLRAGCKNPAKIISSRIKAGKKFCSASCGAMYAMDNTMDMKWCPKHQRWEDEIHDCTRFIPEG